MLYASVELTPNCREIAEPDKAFPVILEEIRRSIQLSRLQLLLPDIDKLMRSPRTAILQYLGDLSADSKHR